MVQEIIPGTLIALAVAFPLHSSPVTSVQTGYQAVYETPKSPTYVVQKDDTLGSIAKSQYGDEGFWTLLWNDNAWIEDPSVIEQGWELTLRVQKPVETEGLTPELTQKITLPQEEIKIPQTEVSTTEKPTAVSTPAAPQVANGPLNEAQINFLGNCEAGMIPTRNTGNGYYGAFQFSYGTWKSMNTGYERADLAPLEVQKDAVQRLLQRSSIYTQFPGCARKMRAIGLLSA